MNTRVIGTQFPDDWLWGRYQTKVKESLIAQIDARYDNSIFIDLTWFGKQYNNGQYDKVIQLNKEGRVFNYAFLLSTVDPSHLNPNAVKELTELLGSPELHLLGNFDDTAYQFDFFAPIIAEHFKTYTNDELLLTDLKYKYINYNRKPREHRVKFMRELIQHDLISCGVNTLGKPDSTYDKDPLNDLFMHIGEKDEDYVQYGHWFDDTKEDNVGIPHDVLSLHNMHYWKHHFLHIIGATEFWPWDDVFVSESQFKPFIGLRPYVINGNTRTYKWLTDRGFKTFNHYFSGINLEDTHEDSVHPNLIKVVQRLDQMSTKEILTMYNDMLPDLYYNKERFFEYAREQRLRVQDLI